MSSNVFTLTCVGEEGALACLHDAIDAAQRSDDASAWPQPLVAIFSDWDSPSIHAISWQGGALRFQVDASAHDDLDNTQLRALQAAGVEHLRVQVFHGQVGEASTTYYRGTKRIAAKSFPQLELSESERLHILVMEGPDAVLAKQLKAGACPDAVIEGAPLFVHLLRHDMRKSARALVERKEELDTCIPFIAELADLIGSGKEKGNEALLAALLKLPDVDLPTMARLRPIMQAVSVHPRLLAWMLAQPDVDASASLYEEDSVLDETGSVLFNSVAFFEDDPEVLAVLDAAGARSVRPAVMPDASRVLRMRYGYRDAETPAELAAAGICLQQTLESMLLALDGSAKELSLIAQMFDAGVNCPNSLVPTTLEYLLLPRLFSVTTYETAGEHFVDGHCLEPARAELIATVFNQLLQRGLSPDMQLTLYATNVDDALGTCSEDARSKPVRFKGTLMGAIAGLLCEAGTPLRGLCLPLLGHCVAHGADAMAACDRSVSDAIVMFGEVQMRANWRWLSSPWPQGMPLLDFLQQRQALSPDPIDTEVIALLRAAVTR